MVVVLMKWCPQLRAQPYLVRSQETTSTVQDKLKFVNELNRFVSTAASHNQMFSEPQFPNFREPFSSMRLALVWEEEVA